MGKNPTRKLIKNNKKWEYRKHKATMENGKTVNRLLNLSIIEPGGVFEEGHSNRMYVGNMHQSVVLQKNKIRSQNQLYKQKIMSN